MKSARNRWDHCGSQNVQAVSFDSSQGVGVMDLPRLEVQVASAVTVTGRGRLPLAHRACQLCSPSAHPLSGPRPICETGQFL